MAADIVRKTANLFDVNNIIDGGAFYPNPSLQVMVPSNNTAILLVPCKPSTTYTVSRSTWITHRFAICFLTSDTIYDSMPITGYQGSAADGGDLILTSTSSTDSQYLCLYYGKTGGSDSSTPAEIQSQLAEVMINEGNTAMPYEPYWSHSLKKFDGAAWQNATVHEF